MTLIDTAEMYGEGAAELIVGRAIRGVRDQVFLVTKAYPHHASRGELPLACERSLQRLGTDVIDLYLLHWRGRTPLAETVEAFEALRASGKIRRWGVSNFDIDDLEELGAKADDCATNQVLYNPEARAIEFDLLPWCQERQMPVMAYSPVGEAGRLLQTTDGISCDHFHTVEPMKPMSPQAAQIIAHENRARPTKRTASARNHGRKAGSDVRTAQMIAACPTNSGVCARG